MIRTFCTLVLFAFAALALPASASEVIAIEDTKIFETSPNAKNGAAFLKIKNSAAAPVRLIGAVSEVADRVELHTIQQTAEGVMQMRAVEHFEVAAGTERELKPQGDHIMLMSLKKPLLSGDKVPLQLVFDNGDKISLVVEVAARGQPAESESADHHHH